jgi:hypothetical protein
MIPIVVLCDMKMLVDFQWKLIVFLRGLHITSMRLLHIIDLTTCILYYIKAPVSTVVSRHIFTNNSSHISQINPLLASRIIWLN